MRKKLYKLKDDLAQAKQVREVKRFLAIRGVRG